MELRAPWKTLLVTTGLVLPRRSSLRNNFNWRKFLWISTFSRWATLGSSGLKHTQLLGFKFSTSNWILGSWLNVISCSSWSGLCDSFSRDSLQILTSKIQDGYRSSDFLCFGEIQQVWKGLSTAKLKARPRILGINRFNSKQLSWTSRTFLVEIEKIAGQAEVAGYEYRHLSISSYLDL